MINTSSSRHSDVGKLCDPSKEFKGMHLLPLIVERFQKEIMILLFSVDAAS